MVLFQPSDNHRDAIDMDNCKLQREHPDRDRARDSDTYISVRIWQKFKRSGPCGSYGDQDMIIALTAVLEDSEELDEFST